jgi:transposase
MKDKKEKLIIKSTKVSTKFSRKNKKINLSNFISEYQKITSYFIDALWGLEKVPVLLDKSLTSGVKTHLSARVIQAAGKQASGIVRGTRKKQERRLYQINKFKSLGMHKKERKLQKIYDENRVSKPSIGNINPQLDSRFVKIDFVNSGEFDGWIILSSLGIDSSIKIPFKKTKHFNKLNKKGSLKGSVTVSSDHLTLMFEMEKTRTVERGTTLGIDIGQNTTLTCSDGQQIESDNHGHNYKSICERLARKKKGSNGFKRTEAHRTNYINWSLNQLNLSGVATVRREKIKGMRKGIRTSRKLSHWNYGELLCKLDAKLNDAGVQVIKSSPTYTSQRCFSCGWVRKGSRKGKQFKCLSCGYTADADLNAAKNISLWLPAISKEQRLRGENKTGFYWFPLEQECIVPVALKQNHCETE